MINKISNFILLNFSKTKYKFTNVITKLYYLQFLIIVTNNNFVFCIIIIII